MFEGFERLRVAGDGACINLVKGGEGPPVLLLHGYPQTHAMWHRVAPALASRFTVVASDLRGYGDSDAPPGGRDHSGYSKRSMAADQVAVMRRLGYRRFAVVGHDRGGRVAHRMALDHPACVSRLAVLDIVPTLTLYRTADTAFATAYYHWFFLIQPYDLPERLIAGARRYYLEKKLGQWAGEDGAFTPEALAEYDRCFDAATIHASCEDYRAAASIDLEHDEADRERRIARPLLVLWGRAAAMHRLYDVLATWREKAEEVEGRALDCGHFLVEERPRETAAALLDFLAPWRGE